MIDELFPNLDEETRAVLVSWLRERAAFHRGRESCEPPAALAADKTRATLAIYDTHAMCALGDAADALAARQYEMAPWPDWPEALLKASAPGAAQA